jgi:hypothetical protein
VAAPRALSSPKSDDLCDHMRAARFSSGCVVELRKALDVVGLPVMSMARLAGEAWCSARAGRKPARPRPATT